MLTDIEREYLFPIDPRSENRDSPTLGILHREAKGREPPPSAQAPVFDWVAGDSGCKWVLRRRSIRVLHSLASRSVSNGEDVVLEDKRRLLLRGCRGMH